MNTPIPQSWWQRVAAFGLVYLALGITSALISNPLQAGLGQASIRVGIFITAIAVFFIHSRVELARPPENPRVSALRVSGAAEVRSKGVDGNVWLNEEINPTAGAAGPIRNGLDGVAPAAGYFQR